MISVAFFNNKGGVGKTTLLCNLAGYFAKVNKKRVLIIDGDPQSNATSYLLDDETLDSIYSSSNGFNLYTYYDSISRGLGYRDVPILKTSPRFGVDLIPGHPKFALREDFLAKDWSETLLGEPRGMQTTFAFRHLLDSLSDRYDYIMVDMGPSLGAINRSILLGVDFFLMPMSADLFSLMAIQNINESLTTWKSQLQTSLSFYESKNGDKYKLDDKEVKWKAKFLGYVTQQYTTKTYHGERRAVKSYDRILQQFPDNIVALEDKFGLSDILTSNLGLFPSLHSLVPMSQLAHAPIFSLKSSDGVVGAHFVKVDEASKMFHEISKNILERFNKFGVSK
ncbi:ParA family protein [Klebsiella pneumoniae]|uniref:ParA family protein n=1 Tax=Klebsiella pneumoniae TaxID=573 RepID=UPI0034CE9CDA